MGDSGQLDFANEIIDLRTPHLYDEAHNPTQSGVIYPPVETPVLIVGGGPVGLLCSILLARYGIRSTIFERHTNRLGQPKSHVINPRSAEIMRQAGLDTRRLRKLGASPADAGVVRFATSMVGTELGSIPFDKQDDAALDFTPEPLFNISQPLLEDYLNEVVIKTGKVTLWREAQWQSSEKTTNGYELSRILNRRTDTIFEYRSKYLLCCDGANARSREQLQIPFPPLVSSHTKPLNHASIHINADLRKMKSGTLWWIWSRSQVGTFISYDRGSSWVFVLTFDPAVSPEATFTEEFCRSQIDMGIGEQVQYDILSITLWKSDTRIADFYRSKTHPAAFLLGDAAHAFPPTGGLGINTGIADAQNLVWKILAVENKWTEDFLLDSYDKDRRAVAFTNASQSLLNGAKMRSLAKAVFGADKPEDPEARMKDPKSRQEIAEAIEDQFDHFNSVNLQLGYVYGASSHASKPCSVYTPEFSPGARLPHAWIQREGSTCSTLDLIDGRSFVLLASSQFSGASGPWHHVGSSKVPVRVLRAGSDFDDRDGNWSRLAGLGQNCLGLLVRPDQHILCKVETIDELDKLEAKM